MAFKIYKLNEEERREYILTLWPRFGERFKPNGGIIDFENDIRLFYYGNGSYMEASDEYQFVFDYKGIAINVNIRLNYDGDDAHYSLIELKGNVNYNIDEIMPPLREAIRAYGNRKHLRYGEDLSDKIYIDF